MLSKKFIHLHLHTEYSLLDGFVKLNEVFQKVKDLNMDAVAITDHGSMFGVVKFYKLAKKNNIKPIIGCELYTAQRKLSDKNAARDKSIGHLIMLVKNDIGYQNLIKLVSISYKEGFYYKPRVDYEIIEKYSEGLVVLSGCLAGEIQKEILNDNYKKAKEIALNFKRIFKDDFYLEMQDHNIERQKKVNRGLIKLSKEINVKLVATNDVHYLNKEDSIIHDALLCIQTGKIMEETDRMKFPSNEFYLKSYDEMYEIFENVENCLDNTVEIANKCNYDFDFSKMHLPVYKIESDLTSYEYLKALCVDGLKERYEIIDEKLKLRLQNELNVIKQMGFEDYFLIVWDFIKVAKEKGIYVGPGRGSAGGSLVAYSLKITDVDPIKYGLIFERFLNPERITMPDIDIDFEDTRRHEVIDYVIDKYGIDNVSQIITFGTMAARAAVRDVGRVLNITYSKVDKVAKTINRMNTLTEELKNNIELKKLVRQDDEIKTLIKFAKRLEGVPRHASTHAAGVVISKKSVDSYVPLYMQDHSITTQYDMTLLEELGLLKMDFLGLRTLTIIKNSILLIEKNLNKTIVIEDIDIEDAKTYELISKGDTLGVFQLESSGMQKFMKQLKPKNIEDIIAGLSLYRPGPMESIPIYIKNKNNPENITYLHPLLKPILEVTYGILVYQEQVMEIVRKLAGYSYGRSDLVRRMMGKKKIEVMKKEREIFIYGQVDLNGRVIVEGCIRRGVNKEIANIIFDDMVDFAKYAFNKSHAAGYAVIAYQTAYLKTHYTVEFMAALMTSVLGNHSKLSLYIQNSKDLGIELLSPNINKSYKNFAVENGNIRYGLLAIKNVGTGIIKEIESKRKNKLFNGFVEFCERIESSELNKRDIESLIKSGAFDGFNLYRSQLLAIFDRVVSSVHTNSRKNVRGQVSLFEGNNSIGNDSIINYDIPNINELNDDILLQFEKEVLGIYLSNHPFSKWRKKFENLKIQNINEFIEKVKNQEEKYDSKQTVLIGMISKMNLKVTKNSNEMAFLTIEDIYNEQEIIVFPKVYYSNKNILKVGNPIIVRGKISYDETEVPKIIALKIEKINDSLIEKMNENNKKLYIKIKNYKIDDIKLIKRVLNASKGEKKVVIYLESKKEKLELDGNFLVAYSEKLKIDLEKITGENSVKYC